jgi:hypothetical protein
MTFFISYSIFAAFVFISLVGVGLHEITHVSGFGASYWSLFA